MMPGITSTAPDQLAPQQNDNAMSGFNGLEAGVEVRTSILCIYDQSNLTFAFS